MRSSPFARPDAALAADRQAWLVAQPFAHRGLHGPRGRENSRSAFAAAIADGHGIELDVRLSRDGFAMVFHDRELDRLTGAAGPLRGLTAGELGTVALGADRIETLSDILAFVSGRAPLLIELKTDGEGRSAARLCLSVRHALEGYGGRAAVMSFDPEVGRWFAAHAPRIARGLVVSREDRPRHPATLVRRHLSLRGARPHFLACDVRSLPSPVARRSRRRGLPVLAWTVRNAEDYALACAHADQIIFESP